MTTPEHEPVQASEETPRRRGLALAALSVGAGGATVSLATWAAWLLVRPGMITASHYSFLAQVFVLVLGGLWFVSLPIGVLGLVFGLSADARTRPGSARAGAYLAGLTLLAALAGSVTFAGTPLSGPVAYPQPLIGNGE